VGFNLLDLLIVLALFSAAVGGFRLGFVARVVSWILMTAAVLIAARLLPSLLRAAGDDTGDAELLLLAGAVLVGSALLGQSVGLVLGTRLNVGVRSGVPRQIDSVAGAVAGMVGVLVTVWLLVPALAEATEVPARLARESRLARGVADVFPDPPDVTRVLRRLVGEDYPRVFDSMRPAPDLGPPPAASGLDAGTADAVSRSTVKVVGRACDRIQEGSGFVVADDLVVTNAHVVAGQEATEVERSDGSRVAAVVTAFDPETDLAVLSAPGLDRPPLAIGEASAGTRGGVFGYPGGGALEISPFVVGRQAEAVGSDIYDAGRTRRQVLFLSAELAPGDSGSALVDPAGRVVGVAFAVAPDQPGVAYALTTGELQEALAGGGGTAIDTGPCLR
jgi:S1-C subfamily serine protease